MQLQPTQGHGYRAIVYFLRQYKLLYGALMILTLVTAALESIGVMAFFPLFSSLLQTSEETPGGILAVTTNAVSYIPIADPIIAALALLVLVMLTKTIFTLCREILGAYGSARLHYSVKRQIMDRYASAHYQFFLDNRQGTLLYNLLDAPSSVSGLLLQAPQMMTHLLKTLTITLILLFIFPEAALVLIAVGLGYYGFAHFLSKKVSYRLGQGMTQSGIEQTVLSNEFISGFRQIVTLNVARRWVEGFDRESKQYASLFAKNQSWLAVPRPLMELFAIGLLLGFILLLRVNNADNFYQDLATLGVFAVSLVQIMPSIAALGRMRMEIMTALPNVELAYQALTAPVPRRSDGHRALDSLKQGITFDNVSFAYRGREPLFRGVNLTIDKGQVAAIVGPSGTGKTTIINLILGLFEPSAGSVRADGIPIQELTQESWLGKIGFVSQDTFLFHSSISDNILFGREGHTQESVIRAAKIANAHDFITELPLGYDTVVGDRGMRLSGGQQQRLAIARAMLNDPEILIFDEATSSLDTIAERQVQQAIDNVSSDRTVILIAHRLSTVQRADKIIVIHEGQVVEEGTHQELLEKDGHYSQLVAASS